MILSAKTGCVASGRLVKDPEQSTFGAKGWPKTRFTIAYGDKREESPLLRCEAVFELAEETAALRKGDRVIVGGVLDSFAGRDGTPKRVLLADAVACLGVKPAAGKPDRPAAPQQAVEGFGDINDEELPF